MYSEKSEIIPILQTFNYPPHCGIVGGGGYYCIQWDGRTLAARETNLYADDFKGMANFRIPDIPPDRSSSVKNINPYLIIRHLDMTAEEFHNYCMLFLEKKNPDYVSAWMTVFAIVKGDKSVEAQRVILSATNPSTKSQMALAYAYHCLYGRFDLYEQYMENWIVDSGQHRQPIAQNAPHFVYAYSLLADPYNHGNESYERFLLNNPYAYFHITPYANRTQRFREEFDRVLYKHYVTTGSKYFKEYTKALWNSGIDPISRMKETVGEDISNIVVT